MSGTTPDTGQKKGSLIVLADDDHVQARLLARWLEREGHEVIRVEDGRACLDTIHERLADVVLLDLHMPRMSGLEALERLQTIAPHLPVVMLTSEQSVESVVQAMQLGAYDYLTKPIDRLRLLSTLKHATRAHELAVRDLERAATSDGGTGFPGLISEADAMRPVFRQMTRLASCDITVLVHGESGTGKELVASGIHARSGRSRRGAFVPVNCAAIPATLQESQLFGHEKGAFTGADRRHVGFFEQADGGTLFLDEVAELSPALQAALLRVLQERRVRRVGASTEIDVDVRVIAASHKRLADEVAQGRFREDLFYRLAVFELELPRLRERAEDIPLLMRHFLDQLCKEQSRATPEFEDAAARALVTYPWPGNVRELRNAMQRALVMADDVLDLSHLPRPVREAYTGSTDTLGAPGAPDPLAGVVPMAELERRAILHAYAHTEGNATRASKLLGISRATLYRRLGQYGVLTEDGA